MNVSDKRLAFTLLGSDEKERCIEDQLMEAELSQLLLLVSEVDLMSRQFIRRKLLDL